MRPPVRLIAAASEQSSISAPRIAAMPPIFSKAAGRTSMQPPAAAASLERGLAAQRGG